MLKKPTFKRLQHKLMLAFLALSITPLVLLGVFFLSSHTRDLEAQSTAHLAYLRDNKKEQILTYFTARYSEVTSFSRSELATASGGRFYGLVAAFHQLGDTQEQVRKIVRARYVDNPDNPQVSESRNDDNFITSERYRLLHNRYDRAFKEYLKRSDFSDVLLVDIKGNVVYSAQKDALFAANLREKQWDNTAVGAAFADISKKISPPFVDIDKSSLLFSDFRPSENNEMVAWFAAPITQQGYLHSYLLLKLPNRPLVNMLKNKPNENAQVSTLLVAKDRLPRNLISTGFLFPITSSAIDAALSGASDVGRFLSASAQPVLGAYAPITILEKQWALILELPEDEAFAQIQQLEKIFVIVMVFAIFLVVLASHLLSNSITAPLLRLTWAAERVAAGDLDQKITSTTRQDEIGRLAISFARMQRSVREKLTLIHEQNKALEQKNDELQQADRMKDDFLASTSHELRTPLHGMIGIAEAMLADTDGPEHQRARAQLQIIINSGQRLSSLVDDLLDYHKMRHGDLDMFLHAVDTATVIRLVIELSSQQLGAKPVRIINQIPIDLPLVLANEQRLEQVLYKLIGNAIKYTDEGKIVISATVLEKELRIQVVDTGKGISPDQLEYLFEPLTQISTTRAYRQSAGLGLSITKQLIDIMGGQLYVSSQTMVGTTLSFTLPLATQEDKAKTQLAQSQLTQNVHFTVPKMDLFPIDIPLLPDNPTGPLILVVDDEPVNLQILNNFLRLEGYRVKMVENGRQAIESVTIEKPALILLDVMMPELSGYDVCAHLRLRYNNAELPIIMLSALGQVQDKLKGFDAGANDYLIKPFNKFELSARIRAYINASLTEQERENNRQLQNDIVHLENLEMGLRQTQDHLFSLLDSAEEAIVSIDKNEIIRYANIAASSFFKLTPDALLSCHLNDFLAIEWSKQHKKSTVINTNSVSTNSIKFKIEGQIIDIEIDVLMLPPNSELHMLLLLHCHKKGASQRVHLLENAVETLADYAFNGKIGKLEQLRELGNEFSQMADIFTEKKPEKGDVLRETLVKVMSQTLRYWHTSTGKSKFDLAEESGLWRVYLDRSTLQTRTLDKYLHVETVPKSPRWRTVLDTIEFVLERCRNESTERADLIFLRDRLQILITR